MPKSDEQNRVWVFCSECLNKNKGILPICNQNFKKEMRCGYFYPKNNKIKEEYERLKEIENQK